MGKYDLSEEAKATDDELSSALNKLGLLSDSEIANLLPDRIAQDELKKLIDIVNQASNENAKRVALCNNLKTFSESVQNIVKSLV